MSQPVWLLWAGLTLFFAASLAALARMIGKQRARTTSYDDGPVIRDYTEIGAGPESGHAELEAQAWRALAAAQRAETDAEQALAAAAEAEVARDSAWQEHTAAADLLSDVATRTGTFPAVRRVPAPEQLDISRAAREAYRRGEITVDELHAVWQRVGGWDPDWAERARELARHRARSAETWRRYELAALRERSARRRADIAVVAARALAEEAAEAAREAQRALLAAGGTRPGQSGRTRPHDRPPG